MAAITDLGVFGDGILQPQLMNRFRIGQLEGFSDELNSSLTVQTVSFSYDECTQKRKAMITWVIEDDQAGVASRAVEAMEKHKSLTVHNLNGAGDIITTITLIGVELLNVQYELDYAKSNACRYVLTLSTNHKITRKFPNKAVDAS